MGCYYGIDWTYIILVLPAVLFSMWASAHVNGTYKKYSQYRNRRGITAEAASRYILDRSGLQHIRIEHVSGELTDHYDPAAQVIRLSDSVYGSTSIAAVGVACHETGHAIQHAENYTPVKIRTAIVPITNIGAKLSVPLIIIGLVLASLGEVFVYIAYAGVACYALCLVFQLVTLPTEFDASRRALSCIRETNLLVGDEYDGAKKVLTAAALTYVAALAVTFMQLLRFIIIVSGSRRRD